MTKPQVGPSNTLETHHVSLSDGVHEFGITLEGGVSAIMERPLTPSTIHLSGGRSAFGDWEPGLAQIGQSTWVGGRGNDSFALDSSRYLDGKMAFTMVDGKLFPVPMWKMGEGQTAGDNKLPGAGRNSISDDVDFVSLASAHYAQSFVASSSYTATRIQLWIKKVGSPSGNLTLSLRSNSSGPSTVLQSVTIAPTDITDTEATFVDKTITGQSLTATTTYFVSAHDASGGSAANHWEVGFVTGGSAQAYTSSDGSSWSTSATQLAFRVVPVRVDRTWTFFEYKKALYAYDYKAARTASVLFLNGDRGIATSGSATNVTDSTKSWTTNRWAGARVRIIAGTGKGLNSPITSNTSTALTISSIGVTLDNTSQYVIYSTDEWTDISPASGDQIDTIITDHLVASGVVYFARGDAVALFKMEWNSSTPGHNFRDDAGTAVVGSLLHGFTDATNSYQLFLGIANTSTVYRKSLVAYGSNLAEGTAITVGDTQADINNIHDYNGVVYVFKEDGIYRISSDKALREDTGLDFVPSPDLGNAVVNRNFFMYFSWGGYALQQFQKNSSIIDMASIGPDRGEGMPTGRGGSISHLGFHPAGLFASIDAGTSGTSSVLVKTDPTGWHEVFRAPVAGWRVRNFYWQDCPGTNPRLWIDLGDEIAYQEWPQKSFNPIKDEAISHQFESELVMSDIDMGAPRLPKYIKEISIVADNLNTNTWVSVDYQKDDDIGTTTWTHVGEMFDSPFDTLPVNAGNLHKIRFRLRPTTTDADNPPIIFAAVVEGFARTPLKKQWTMRATSSSYNYIATTGAPDHAPQDLRDFLNDAAMNAKRITMKTSWTDTDGIFVIVEPYTSRPTFKDQITNSEGHSLEFTVREA